MVVENSNKVLVGYACAALDSKLFYQGQEVRLILIAYLINILMIQPLGALASEDV